MVARLRVEMRDRVDLTRIQTPLPQAADLRSRDPAYADSDYDWAVAFTEKGDMLADGHRR